jgi:hypothetical protein
MAAKAAGLYINPYVLEAYADGPLRTKLANARRKGKVRGLGDWRVPLTEGAQAA